MLSHLFLGLSLIGAEWVLYLLLALSVISVALILERVFYYRAASRRLSEFRDRIRQTVLTGKWDEAIKLAEERARQQRNGAQDLEAALAFSLMTRSNGRAARLSTEVLDKLARDSLTRGRLSWDRNLSVLATIGSNAPFVGLFGTVLGIIKAFHDLSQQATAGAQTVTAGISEALVATAVGILVAIPAVVAFNLFQRKVKSALAEAEALKCFLIAELSAKE
ncbi:MAG: MotA/TolQ/ExbB proton channel family protein [Oligoflexia bacterium]|nr:MotA/TolQ/ExbB proton channel family protein [Oligoflexia bacterium]